MNNLLYHYSLLFFIFLTWDSISLCQQSNWINISTQNSKLPSNSIHSVIQDNEGSIWIGTWGSGLVRITDGQWAIYDTSNSSIGFNTIYDFFIDSKNQIWVGTFGGGLSTVKDKEFVNFSKPNSGIADNTIYSLDEDDEESLLIGSWGGGLTVFNKSGEWKNYNKFNSSLPTNKATAVKFFHDTTWIGTSGGLAALAGSNWIKFDTDDLLQSVYSIEDYKDSVLWVGFKFGGIAKYCNGEWIYFNMSNSEIPSNTVYDIAIDRDGNLWAAHFGSGVSRFDGDKWTHYDESNSELSDDFVFSIYIDKQNSKWFCTMNGGISVYNEQGIPDEIKSILK